MKLRKCLLRVGALVLTLALLCVPVLATEQQSQRGNAELSFRINPVYEDLYDAAALQELLTAARENAEAEDGKVSNQMPTLQTGKKTYLNKEQAALQLRQQMEARQNRIELYISAPTKDYNTLIAQIVDLALVHTGDPTEGDYLRWHFGGWEGEVDWERSGENYLYVYDLTMLYYTSAKQEQELDGAIDNLISALNLTEKSDYEKVYAVYDYICDNITYDNAHLYDNAYTLKNSAYAALLHNTAVCQGYANLLYRLMLELGIDCRTIAGDAYGPHAWNIVKLGNVYYNLDSTWDAGTDSWEYFLQNSEGFADHYRYMDYATAQFHADYPMSETDYADGVAGEPENIYVAGICGDDAYWALGRDRTLTIVGTGQTYDYENTTDLLKRPEWEYWDGTFDTVVVEEGITGLGDYLFMDENDLQHISLPDSLVSIGDSALRNCVALEKLQLPENLAKTGEFAFAGCIALTEVQIPETVQLTLGKYSFSGCTALTEVTIPAGVIGEREVFANCTGLEVAHVYSADLGEMAFYHCSALSEMNLYDTVEKIRDGMFTGCVAMTSVTIPDSVTLVDNNAFLDCRSLMEIRFQGDAPTFGTYTFNNLCHNGDVFVYYPCSNETWTQELMETAGSSFGRKEVSWIAGVHSYKTTEQVADCIHDGMVIKVCTACQDRVEFWNQYATGQHTFTDEEDTICDVCGGTRDLKMPTTPMYRLYNKNSGEHFYTGSVEERDMLIEAGWQYEGIAWNAPTKYGAPVYRLYNPNSGDHHYTMSGDERDMLVGVGWKFEGVAWNSASSSNIPMYRLYNPNADCGSHHYTGSEEERDYLVSLGWHYEGIGWYGLRN